MLTTDVHIPGIRRGERSALGNPVTVDLEVARSGTSGDPS
jgi:hypothetical protein